MGVDAHVYVQIDAALAKLAALAQRSQFNDLSDIPEEELLELRTMSVAAIERLSPPDSEYRRAASEAIEHYSGSACRQLGGILKALRSAYNGGYLKRFEEIVAADVFSDFLSMSEHLLSAGYKDPAAVIVGATLEEHLRRLTRRAGAPTLDPGGRPLRADALNTELARRSIYRKLDQKNVTAWLGLRNHAAHGEFEAYESEQVKLMIDGVRVFLAQHP